MARTKATEMGMTVVLEFQNYGIKNVPVIESPWTGCKFSIFLFLMVYSWMDHVCSLVEQPTCLDYDIGVL